MLKDFFLNENMRNEVKGYFETFFKEEAVRKLMNREDAIALADATELLTKGFDNLEVMFASKSEGKEIINKSR